MPQYYAKSVLRSKTMWFNVGSLALVILELQEVINVIPPGWMPYVSMLMAVVNVILRFEATRPVAMIGVNESQAVTVKALPS